MRTSNAAVPQLTLPGFEATQLALEHRFFFAVMPDPDTAECMAERGARLGAGMRVDGRPLHAERLHVTLQLVGDFAYVPEVILARACVAAASIDVPSFGVTFDQILSFNGRPGHRPLVLTGSDGLDELVRFQRLLVDALRGARLRVSGARFTPHLTLLYGDGRVTRCPTEPITWTVREFVLIHSWLGKTHYDVIGRWPLTDSIPTI
ncbi:ligase [Burkholderia cepacia]|uniref:Ligase n=1 Tax=Burkholderia cepacia TaxID=292 RepID=A0A2S8IXX0_BURCE|nr:2'-5' RNA ligase family protein [Burkholderia cepacia]PQP19646.1 ligase [Burkholderia cepacia]HDR9506831.1 2'-5' RNA ligase family protein [Burkholderia cepacia]